MNFAQLADIGIERTQPLRTGAYFKSSEGPLMACYIGAACVGLTLHRSAHVNVDFGAVHMPKIVEKHFKRAVLGQQVAVADLPQQLGHGFEEETISLNLAIIRANDSGALSRKAISAWLESMEAAGKISLEVPEMEHGEIEAVDMSAEVEEV